MRVVCPPRTCLARVLPAIVWGAAVLLAGCGSSNSNPPGTPVLTMGDLTNSSDFTSYIVAIDSVTLTASDGTLVTPVVTPETVDLVRLNSMTELVEAPAVPSDTYTSATVTVDYSAASIWLNFAGQPVASYVVGNTGAVFGAETVTVTFDPDHPLVITAGQSIRLQLDVDVTASSSVVTTSPPTVQVQPFVTMRVAPVDSTVMRARGLFVVVPTGSSIPPGTSGTFIMNVRPFFDVVSALGAVFVNTNAQTYWNINGVTYTGAAGLNALAPQQESIPIVVYGTLDNLSGITPTFNATSVYVGSSQESPLAEYLTGVVAARTDDTLTLLGVTYLQPTGVYEYVASTPVTIGPQTIVSQDGVANPGLTPASVSVGQQINVSGQAAVNSSTGALEGLDATAGQVRLQPTNAWGTPTAIGAGSVTLDLLSLGGFPGGFATYYTTSLFKFDGTGSSAGNDATRAAYAVNTGSLDTSALTATMPALAQGIVTPFGSAPPDFTASAITPGSSTLQTLVVEWASGGSPNPFSTWTAAGLTVNLSNPDISALHYIRTGPTTVDLKTLPASPLITWVGADQSNLDLAVGGATLTTGVSVFSTPTGFLTGLKNTLNGTNKVFRLVAYGQYNAATNTFVAARIHVAIEETTS
jgi:hypothetical protein